MPIQYTTLWVYVYMSALTEQEVGIFEYVALDVPGIGGRLKTIPADFQVNELRVDGSAPPSHAIAPSTSTAT